MSHIWSLICLPSMVTIRAPNSTPKVKSTKPCHPEYRTDSVILNGKLDAACDSWQVKSSLQYQCSAICHVINRQYFSIGGRGCARGPQGLHQGWGSTNKAWVKFSSMLLYSNQLTLFLTSQWREWLADKMNFRRISQTDSPFSCCYCRKSW